MEQLPAALGDEIEDPEEEAFLVFSQPIPSQNLGFVDPKAEILELNVAGRDFSIRQSPGVLTSNREGGTTGAVVWKVTPAFSAWLCSPNNILFRTGLIDAESTAVELGCGISGLVALSLAPKIRKYLATDQTYVLKLLDQNIRENSQHRPSAATPGKKQNSKRGDARQTASSHGKRRTEKDAATTIETVALDWQTDSVLSLQPYLPSAAVNVVIACDCIYNESLIPPFVSTCADVCRSFSPLPEKPTLCIVAQQLRSPDVFEAWLKEFWKYFRVRRLPDEELDEGLKEGSGFVVHIGMLRSTAK
ncbi:hypothetical protein NA57DRAFT_46800 [Rhizodiscina lignyota]|uniref:Diaminohydroxyphosphoribosylamino-pyrimidine deaminase n=1 Tax=Rhizodiscina lignyota TaxID=1504668 RepID=A0A9P4I852_9PEZI|nr:hypothetical protein NA57DRAFT_46800 [Rhizodiscina lignyota]